MISENKIPAIAPCPSYETAEVRKALGAVIEAAGGLDWVKPGMRIGIKVNLCAGRKPETATTTHPVPVAELVKMLRERGADAVVGDSPGEPFTPLVLNRIYNVAGLKLVTEAGGALNDDYTHSEVQFPEGKSVRSFEYCSWLSKCDAVINFCKLKAHGLMGMTAAVKNLYGVIPGTMKSEYHFLHTDPTDFANMLVDLNEYVKPRLVLVDAVEIMEGNGPTQGTPRLCGALVAGTNPYNIDRLNALILGVNENELPYMTAAKQRGLLSETADAVYSELAKPYLIKDFKRSGATSSWFIYDPSDKPVKKVLKRALYILLRSKPQADSSCTGCGYCARNCPAKAIEIKNGKAKINRKACVRCFCCQEFCPSGAMKAERSPLAKIVQ